MTSLQINQGGAAAADGGATAPAPEAQPAPVPEAESAPAGDAGAGDDDEEEEEVRWSNKRSLLHAGRFALQLMPGVALQWRGLV